MFGLFTGIKLAAISAGLVYVFSIVSDYKSQAVQIVRLEQRVAVVSKQNEYWEGRYQRIVEANRNKGSAIAIYEEVIDKCCRPAFDRAWRANQTSRIVREVFPDGTSK